MTTLEIVLLIICIILVILYFLKPRVSAEDAMIAALFAQRQATAERFEMMNSCGFENKLTIIDNTENVQYECLVQSRTQTDGKISEISVTELYKVIK